jgi:hypothetical protein
MLDEFSSTHALGSGIIPSALTEVRLYSKRRRDS